MSANKNTTFEKSNRADRAASAATVLPWPSNMSPDTEIDSPRSRASIVARALVSTEADTPQ